MTRKSSRPQVVKRASPNHRPGFIRQILNNTRLTVVLLLSCLVLLSLMGLTVYGERGLLTVWHKQREIAAMVRDIEAIERENARLAHEIQHLRNDMGHIETIAREELGLVKSDELVFEFVNQKHK